jgi:hypothetical protein
MSNIEQGIMNVEGMNLKILHNSTFLVQHSIFNNEYKSLVWEPFVPVADRPREGSTRQAVYFSAKYGFAQNPLCQVCAMTIP